MHEKTNRDEPTPQTDGDDWESVALRRVARHVESLPTADDAVDEDYGWEEAALEKLRRHVGSSGPESS
jgi:hypothetical protein